VLARGSHPAMLDEPHHALQLAAVEPDAMGLADVEESRPMCARNSRGSSVSRSAGRECSERCLERPGSSGRVPPATTRRRRGPRACRKVSGASRDQPTTRRMQRTPGPSWRRGAVLAAPRSIAGIQRRRVLHGCARRRGAAPRAEPASDEHRREARWAGDRREGGTAVFAFGRVGGGWSSATGTAERGDGQV
jgi:hypothetical protein